jgi:signal transduction histidine kinase
VINFYKGITWQWPNTMCDKNERKVEYLSERIYVQLSDSIRKRDELFGTMDVNAQLDNRYQKTLNENPEKDNKLKRIYIVAFAMLAVLSVVIFSQLFINHRKTNLLNRELDLEAERERISKELHDDLGSSLTSMQILAKRLLTLSGGQHQEILNNIVNITDGSIDQMGEIIWMLNDTTGTLGGLIAHLRVYMADYIQTTGLQLS